MISIRDYARRRGISHTAVQKAVKTGRLSKSIQFDAGGHAKIIDSDLADREWAANTDQASPSNIITGEPKRRKDTATAPYEPRLPATPMQASAVARATPSKTEPDPPPDAGPPDPGRGPTYTQSRAVRETYLARLSKLDYEEKSSKLIPADAVRVAMFNAARKCRDMLMGLPDRVAPLVLGCSDLFEIQRVLTDEVRRACTEIANLKPPERAE